MYPVLMLVARSAMLDCGGSASPFHARGEKILGFGVVSGIGARRNKVDEVRLEQRGWWEGGKERRELRV